MFNPLLLLLGIVGAMLCEPEPTPGENNVGPGIIHDGEPKLGETNIGAGIIHDG